MAEPSVQRNKARWLKSGRSLALTSCLVKKPVQRLNKPAFQHTDKPANSPSRMVLRQEAEVLASTSSHEAHLPGTKPLKTVMREAATFAAITDGHGPCLGPDLCRALVRQHAPDVWGVSLAGPDPPAAYPDSMYLAG